MTETMNPRRSAVCTSHARELGGPGQHQPARNTVESEFSIEMEWHFGTCMYCWQGISRFRVRNGGTSFDRWGDVEDDAYLIAEGGS